MSRVTPYSRHPTPPLTRGEGPTTPAVGERSSWGAHHVEKDIVVNPREQRQAPREHDVRTGVPMQRAQARHGAARELPRQPHQRRDGEREMDLEKRQRDEGRTTGTGNHEERESHHNRDLDDRAHTHEGHMQGDLAAADARCTVDQNGRPRHRPGERRHGRGWGAHRPRSIFHRSTTLSPPPSPVPRTTWYASKCGTVRHEWLGMISTLSPTVKRPSSPPADAARIKPCSCDSVATVTSGASFTAPIA